MLTALLFWYVAAAVVLLVELDGDGSPGARLAMFALSPVTLPLAAGVFLCGFYKSLRTPEVK